MTQKLLDLEKVCLEEGVARVDTLDLLLGFRKMPFDLLKLLGDFKSMFEWVRYPCILDHLRNRYENHCFERPSFLLGFVR